MLTAVLIALGTAAGSFLLQILKC